MWVTIARVRAEKARSHYFFLGANHRASAGSRLSFRIWLFPPAETEFLRALSFSLSLSLSRSRLPPFYYFLELLIIITTTAVTYRLPLRAAAFDDARTSRVRPYVRLSARGSSHPSFPARSARNVAPEVSSGILSCRSRSNADPLTTAVWVSRAREERSFLSQGGPLRPPRKPEISRYPTRSNYTPSPALSPPVFFLFFLSLSYSHSLFLIAVRAMAMPVECRWVV